MALVIALNILVCKFIDAPMKTDTNVAHLIKTTINIATFMAEYIITQNWRDITLGVSDST